MRAEDSAELVAYMTVKTWVQCPDLTWEMWKCVLATQHLGERDSYSQGSLASQPSLVSEFQDR